MVFSIDLTAQDVVDIAEHADTLVKRETYYDARGVETGQETDEDLIARWLKSTIMDASHNARTSRDGKGAERSDIGEVTVKP